METRQKELTDAWSKTLAFDRHSPTPPFTSLSQPELRFANERSAMPVSNSMRSLSSSSLGEGFSSSSPAAGAKATATAGTAAAAAAAAATSSSSSTTFPPLTSSFDATEVVLTPGQRQIIRRLVSSTEGHNLLKDETACFTTVDGNEDGLVNDVEFRQAVIGAGLNLSRVQLEELFAAIDADKTGSVDVVEFVAIFEEARRVLNGTAADLDFDEVEVAEIESGSRSGSGRY